MKDNRNEMIPAQFVDWTWDLSGYAAKVPFYNADDLTMREVQNVFQLDPEPPQMELNDYIREALYSGRAAVLPYDGRSRFLCQSCRVPACTPDRRNL